MVVLGVSFDPPEVNRAFAVAQGFPFPLLSDTQRRTALAYGAAESADDAFPRRRTFLIDAKGRIERALDTRDPATQADELLRDL